MAFVGIELLREKPQIWYSHQFDLLLKKLKIDSQMSTLGDKQNNGFYDWLRNYQGKIVGVHHKIFDEYWAVIDRTFKDTVMRDIYYASLKNENSFLEILLEPGASIDYSISDDQDFGINAIIKNDNHIFCAVFELNDIDLEEFSSGTMIKEPA